MSATGGGGGHGNEFRGEKYVEETPLCDDDDEEDVRSVTTTSSGHQSADECIEDEIGEVRRIMNATLTANDIRTRFIEYFKRFDHTFVPSSRIVLQEDKSLLFVNAGMNQFKPIFTGDATENRLRRAVNSQKCIRAGGKHNDLDDVGKDVYHHTFFEMLGSWSFGDYFKSKAIDLAWSFLILELELDPNRFYVTYFDPHFGRSIPQWDDVTTRLERDEETRQIWRQYLPDERILPGSTKDNFWEMGETGPCGPCTEIHYDRLGRADASHLVNADDPEVIEVWNLVFMQYYRNCDGDLTELPEKHVDTGMGLERLVSIVQGKHSNYDTDIFSPIFDAISELTEVRPYSGKVGADDVEDDHQYASLVDTAYRVIADHMRTICVAIADGVLPDNKDRGYVIRRILRRAIRYAKDKLFARCGTLTHLVRPVCQVLSHAFPEFDVEKSPKLIETIETVVCSEEQQFYRSLARGTELLQKHIDGLASKMTRILDGGVAWKLYDTDGFPLDLTVLMCAEKGIVVDMDGWERARADAIRSSKRKPLNRQRPDDQIVTSLNVKLFDVDVDDLPKTIDEYKYDYDWLEKADTYSFEPIRARVLAVYVEEEGVNSVCEVDCCSESAAVVLDKTCMYAESGGQVSDTGLISAGETRFNVVNVQKMDGVVLHYGRILNLGSVKVGDIVQVSIHNERRIALMRNHTATHLLNFVLSEIVPGAEQRGSLVLPDRLRFDFACMSEFGITELINVEDLVTRYVAEACYREVEVVQFNRILMSNSANNNSAGTATTTTAATSSNYPSSNTSIKFLRGEKYPEHVRVVRFKRKLDNEENNEHNHSAELCAGTHLENTSSIQKFIITNLESIARGIKRIVAVTGPEDAAIVAKTDTAFGNDIDLIELAYEQLNAENNIVEMIDTLGPEIKSLLSKLEGHFTSYVFKENARERLNRMMAHIGSEKRKRQATAANEERTRFRDEIERITIAPPYLIRLINPIPHIESIASNESRKVINIILTGFKQRLSSTSIALFSYLPLKEQLAQHLNLSTTDDIIEFVMMAHMPKLCSRSAKQWVTSVVETAARKYGTPKNEECKVGGNDQVSTGHGKINCSIENLLNVAHDVATDLFQSDEYNNCSVKKETKTPSPFLSTFNSPNNIDSRESNSFDAN